MSDSRQERPMERLESMGFSRAGSWKAAGDGIAFTLTHHANDPNVLYAFVANGNLKYIGKTVKGLTKRMPGYRSPGATQYTNHQQQ
jgi:hypothetical protein